DHLAKRRVYCLEAGRFAVLAQDSYHRFGSIWGPGPGVAKPERRQQMERGRFGASVPDADLNQQVLGRVLGILNEDVGVTVIVRDDSVEQLIFTLATAPLPVGPHQIVIWVSPLRVLVEVLHVGVGRRGVQIEVILLAVLTMVAFIVGKAEEALFKDRVATVP